MSRPKAQPTPAPIIAPNLLLEAYASGMFPMAMENGEMGWFSPDPRGIIPIKDFHVPHGLKKILKKHPYEIRCNTAFADILLGCADRETTWISEMIHRSYVKLHEMGYAHSIEIWQDDLLVGGLYGIALGGAFFGESMYSRVPNASKIALAALVPRLDERGFVLLDTQWVTEHLTQFGAHEIPRAHYLKRLRTAHSSPSSPASLSTSRKWSRHRHIPAQPNQRLCHDAWRALVRPQSRPPPAQDRPAQTHRLQGPRRKVPIRHP